MAAVPSDISPSLWTSPLKSKSPWAVVLATALFRNWIQAWLHFEHDSANGLTTNAFQTPQTQFDPSVCWIWAILFSQAAQKEATLICVHWRLKSSRIGFLSCAKRAVL